MSEVKCENCIHFERCNSIQIKCNGQINNADGTVEYVDSAEEYTTVCNFTDASKCAFYKNKDNFIELPFIAMVEQELKDGKFNIRRTNRNGATAVVYFDKEKWCIPLIDITNQYYNYEEAKARVKELKENTK